MSYHLEPAGPANGWSRSMERGHGDPGRSCISAWTPTTGEIITTTLTSHDVDDGSQVGPLLDQFNGPVSSFTGDGAFDRDDVYDEIAARHPDAPVIVPPRSNAVPSSTAETAPTQRDRHLQFIA
jgi:hypothetical protein